MILRAVIDLVGTSELLKKKNSYIFLVARAAVLWMFFSWHPQWRHLWSENNQPGTRGYERDGVQLLNNRSPPPNHRLGLLGRPLPCPTGKSAHDDQHWRHIHQQSERLYPSTPGAEWTRGLSGQQRDGRRKAGASDLLIQLWAEDAKEGYVWASSLSGCD